MTDLQADDVRWLQRLDSFKRARAQLQAAVDLGQQRSLSELEQQGLIQAFEFTHELAWNVMKDYLRSLGNSTVIASRDSTRAAFAAELLADGESWMDMIVSRNLSSHTYNRDTANSLVQKIAASYAVLFATFELKMMGVANERSH
jgi:nucleotidyltransferase substrate binding protein (TIGR01987 family)